MKKLLSAYHQLFQPQEYFFFTLTYTLLGIAAAQGTLSWQWLLAFVANLLAVAFAFVFNQVTDAPLDILSSSNPPNSNPIATGELPLPIGRLSALLLAIVSIILFVLLGWRALLFGLLTLFLGVLYSWDGLRLKSISLLDLSEHAWLLAVPVFLASYFTQASSITPDASFLLLAILSFSFFGQLSHENRNFPKLGLSRPRYAILLRERRLVHLLIIFFLAAGLTSGSIALFVRQVIPLRVTILWLLLSCILILPSLLRAGHNPSGEHSRPPIHKELEKAAAYALLAQTLAEAFIQTFHW